MGHPPTYVGGHTYFHNQNWLGSRATTADESGTKVQDCEWYSFGELKACTTNTDPYAYTPYGYADYERDSETGLDHMQFRYYNSRIGRFLGADPMDGAIGNPQSFNKLAYVLNNPVRLTDRLGLCPDGGLPGHCAGVVGHFENPMGGSYVVDGVLMPANSEGMIAHMLEMGTAAPCPLNVCEGMADHGVYIRVIYTGGGMYTSCSSTGSFSSADAAGKAAANCADGRSITENREYVGNLYEKDGKFSFTYSRPGDSQHAPFDPSAIPSGTNYAGFYHAHGAYDPLIYSEMFSRPLCDGIHKCDIGLALDPTNQGKPAYLGTPLGRVIKFDPQQNGTLPNGCVLQGDPVVPGPGVSYVPIPKC